MTSTIPIGMQMRNYLKSLHCWRGKKVSPGKQTLTNLSLQDIIIWIGKKDGVVVFHARYFTGHDREGTRWAEHYTYSRLEAPWMRHLLASSIQTAQQRVIRSPWSNADECHKAEAR
jgi:hypothetical protein